MINRICYNKETRQFGFLDDISDKIGKLDTDKLNKGLGSIKQVAGGLGKSILDNRKSISAGMGGLSTAVNLFRGNGFRKSIGSGIKTSIGARIGLGSINKMANRNLNKPGLIGRTKNKISNWFNNTANNGSMNPTGSIPAQQDTTNVIKNQNNGSGNDKGTSGNVTQNQNNGSGNKK